MTVVHEPDTLKHAFDTHCFLYLLFHIEKLEQWMTAALELQ